MSIQLSRANTGTPLTTTDYNSDNLIVETAVNALQSAGSSGGTVTVVSEVDTDTSSELFSANITNPTTTPEITFSRISKAANLVYASPNGTSGKPTMRALLSGDLPIVPFTKGGTGLSAINANRIIRTNNAGTAIIEGAITAGSSKISINPTNPDFVLDVVPANIEIDTLAATTQLSIAKGGTGANTAQSAINALTAVAGATVGYVLTKVGSAVAWAAQSVGIVTLNGLTGSSVTIGTDNIAEGSTNKWNATHTGDATGATALTIAAGVVTYAKMQAVGASKILGNPTASSANASEITLGANLLFVSGVLKLRQSIFANKTANYTMTNLDGTIFGDSTAAAFTVKLPDTTTLTGGEIFTVQRINTGGARDITISTYVTDGTEIIAGTTIETLLALTGIGHNATVQYVGAVSGVKTFRVINKII